jgi:hypothetical protein
LPAGDCLDPSAPVLRALLGAPAEHRQQTPRKQSYRNLPGRKHEKQPRRGLQPVAERAF